MKSTFRWLMAVLVTIAAFGVATWICGALILPHLMKDPGVRWGIAGGLGVALAALAALWGHSYATAEESEEPAKARGTVHNKITGGIQNGPVIQGRDFTGPLTFGTPPPDPEKRD